MGSVDVIAPTPSSVDDDDDMTGVDNKRSTASPSALLAMMSNYHEEVEVVGDVSSMSVDGDRKRGREVRVTPKHLHDKERESPLMKKLRRDTGIKYLPSILFV